MDLTRWLRIPLFHKYAAVFVLLVSGALLTSSLFELYFTNHESRAARVELLQQEAEASAARIGQFVQDIPRQVKWALQPVSAAGPQASDERYFNYLGLLRLAPAITELRYLDDSGKEQLRVSRLTMNVDRSGDNYSEYPEFKEPRPGQPYFSSLYLKDKYEPYMKLGVREEVDQSVTAAEVNLTYIRDLVDRKIGAGGYAFVVDGDGKLIAHRDLNLMYQQLDLSSCPQVSSALGLEPSPAGGLTRDACRPRVLSAHATIDPLGWLVIVEQPEDEALAPLYGSLLRTIVLLLVGLTVSVLASLVLARRMVTPIRELQAGAARIGAGGLDQRIEVRTGDELEALAEEFNRMAARLEDSYKGLEQKVDQRTRELNEQKNELTDALERQTAISGVLSLITRSPTERQAVLDAVAENAAQLCQASGASIWLRDGDLLRRSAGYGLFASEVGAERVINSASMTGRAAASAATVHEPDLASRSVEYPESERLQHGHRSALSAPIMRESEVVGVISIGREQAEDFTEQQIELLETFADQIVIALELTRLFDEIHEKSRQLEIASQHKSQFIAVMHHELRDPLNSILNLTRNVLDGLVSDEDVQDRLQRVHRAGEHLLSLIDEVLDLARIEAGMYELELRDYSWNDILQTVLSFTESRAANKGLRLGGSLSPDLPMGRGEQRKITRAVLNLVGNAIKFTDVGEVCLEVRARDSEFVGCVRDSGPGIPEEHQDKIFEPFHQVDSSTTREKGGTGLGLSIAERIIELHGGRIWLESSPGQGSTFWFTLPIRVERRADES